MLQTKMKKIEQIGRLIYDLLLPRMTVIDHFGEAVIFALLKRETETETQE